jgi:heterodisulfide reductase subunit B
VNLSYYPGCSLHGSSREYDVSTKAVCRALGVELQELDDWVCCGASSGHSLDETLSLALPAKNLKLAAEAGRDLLVPCAACYNRLKAARRAVGESESVRRTVTELSGYEGGGPAVLNWIELLAGRVGLEALRSRVRKPLTGLKAAPYYGCLLVRPAEVTEFDHPEHPRSMDDILRGLGAEPVTWSHRAECCGGSLALSKGKIVAELADGIAQAAIEAGAGAIVTLCPLCLENLDTRQTAAKLPVFYLTEILGLALGVEEAAAWPKKHMIDATSVLTSLRLIP